MEISSLASEAELFIIAVAVSVISQLLKKATPIPSVAIPFLAIILGAIGGLISTALTDDSNYAACAVVGAFSGGASCGAFDGIKGLKTIISEKLATSKDLKTKAAQTESALKAVSDAQEQIESLQAELLSVSATSVSTIGTTGVTPAEAEAKDE